MRLDLVEQRALAGEIARGQQKPRDEADAVPFAIIEHVLATAIDQIVAILHRRHREHLGSILDIGNRHLGEAGIADDAVVDQ